MKPEFNNAAGESTRILFSHQLWQKNLHCDRKIVHHEFEFRIPKSIYPDNSRA